MGSLSNLYISQSYQSLIHFSTDTSASTTLTELEDGVGQGLGIYFNTEGDFRADGRYYVDKGITISGSVLIDTQYSASTPAYYNSFNSISNTIRVQGSYPAAGYDPPSINDVQVGWLVNGENVTNAIVTAITGKGTGDVLVTINQNFARPTKQYIFKGNIPTIIQITGSMTQSGSYTLTGSLSVDGHGKFGKGLEVTGAIDLVGDLTASNVFIKNNLIVSGTINAYRIVTTIESSSVIFSSGSNILGDATNDTQTLIGSIIMSGSSSLTGSSGITGNLNVGGAGTFGGTGSFIGDLTATGNISSSTLSGVGNVTIYSASVNSRLVYLEGPFSTSVDLRLDQLESFSSSLQTTFVTEIEANQTASFFQNQINQKLFTSSFNSYTQSYSQSVAVTTTGLNDRINTLSSFTGSYATTGSNIFIGNETISGSLSVSGSTSLRGNLNVTGAVGINGNMIYSGSVRGNVVALTISGTTSSMDLSLGNFFTITLNASSPCRIEPTNIQPGETITLRVTQPAGGFGTVQFPTNVDYATGYQYSATPQANAVDILTFLSFDTGSLYYNRANQFI